MKEIIRNRLLHLFLRVAAVMLIILMCGIQQAGAYESGRKLLIGIEPEHNIFDQVQRYRVLAGYLSNQLGIEVELTIMSRYGEVVKRFKSLRLDGALLSSYTATLAIREFDLSPLVYLVGQGEDYSSSAYVFVRKDSGMETVADLRGSSLVFVDSATTEGYLFARAFFRKRGVEDLDSYFSRYYFSGSHASAIFAVLDGRADVGSAKDTVFNSLVGKDHSIGKELKIIAKSPPVPEVALCMKNSLDPELLDKLQDILLNMDQNILGYNVLKQLAAKRFVPGSSNDFAVVLKLAEDAEVNMLGGGRD